MFLSQLVTINQEALVANAVNFELMDDPEKICGYVGVLYLTMIPIPKSLKILQLGSYIFYEEAFIVLANRMFI